MLSRLKFEIDDIIDEKFNRIPERLFESDSTTFCDLQMAGGQFIKKIVVKLGKYGHSDENIRSRVFGFSENRFNYIIILETDGLIGTFDIYSKEKTKGMTFDVVVGNPPYQKDNGSANPPKIWDKFVEQSFEVCKEGGYVSLIHPGAWREAYGKFDNIKDLILSKNIHYLNMNDYKSGKNLFGVQTNYDFYVIQNTENNGGLSKINDYDGVEYEFNLNDVQFIPSSNLEKVYDLLANTENDRINFLNNSSYHTQKDYINDEKTKEFKHPCVYSIDKQTNINLKWSKINNKGHFNVPKVIFSNGSAPIPIVDKDGKYGLTEFAYAIVDEPENLENIQKALNSEKFVEQVMCFNGLGNKYDKKIIKYLRKDFWKEFI